MRFVALLRGINVGGNRMIKMAALTDMFYAAGATNVGTYIQSGNVTFAHEHKDPAALITAAISKATGFDVPVMLRTRTQMLKVMPANPFPSAPIDELYVMFLATQIKPPALTGAPNERYKLVGRELYLHLPKRVGNSKLAAAAGKLGGTVRNWRTVQALTDMSRA